MITTPIFYVNGAPHIGHAYTAVLADVVARWNREIQGRETFFLTGTDEHGQKVQEAAEKLQIAPQELCDTQAGRFGDLFRALNLSHDRFIRTTEPAHHEAVAAVWTKLYDDGYIYQGKHEGWYSVSDEAYYTETQVVEKDFWVWNQKVTQMVAEESGSTVEWRSEENYMFRLSAFQDRLLQWLESNPDAVIPPSRHAEVTSFIRSGLKDLSVSRKTSAVAWGIHVPNDSSHMVYVWLDALTNYLTALGHPHSDVASPQSPWPAKFQVVGKDILRFHAVYWPAFLMALELPLPQHIVAHGWWTRGGRKMSKSIGNVVDPNTLLEHLSSDQFRFYLCREGGALGGDIDFDEERVAIRVTNELANELGNLVRRVLTPALYRDPGITPTPGELTSEDEAIRDVLNCLEGDMGQHMDRFLVHLSLESTWQVVRATNKYLAVAAPWALRKGEEPEQGRADTVMYVALEALRIVGIALQPFTPDASATLLSQLGVPEDRRAGRDMKFGVINAGHPLDLSPLILFPKIDANVLLGNDADDAMPVSERACIPYSHHNKEKKKEKEKSKKNMKGGGYIRSKGSELPA